MITILSFTEDSGYPAGHWFLSPFPNVESAEKMCYNASYACVSSLVQLISVLEMSGHLAVIRHNKVAMSHITALISFSSSAVIIFACIVSLCACGTVSVRTRPHTEASCIQDTLVLGTFWCFGPSLAASSPSITIWNQQK